MFGIHDDQDESAEQWRGYICGCCGKHYRGDYCPHCAEADLKKLPPIVRNEHNERHEGKNQGKLF